MKQITIIGAAGFVGSRLVESCLLAGHKPLLALVRTPRSLGKLCRFGSALEVNFADAENADALSTAIKNSSVVVNATTSDDPKAIINSTRAIYTACVIAGVERYIHLSSAVVYGQIESPNINDDSPPVKKHWMPYARAKIDSELFLKQASESSPVHITVLRPGIVWGPRSPWTLSVAHALKNRTASLVGDGLGVCNTIYIDNLIACILACCDSESKRSGLFNVADDQFVTWYDFYASLAEYFQYDMAKIPSLNCEQFKPSFQSILEDLKSSSTYNWLKLKLSEDKRYLIKFWLKYLFSIFGDHIERGRQTEAVQITREMWHLQTVKHKLSNDKFSYIFNYRSPFSFSEGTLMTVKWLKFLGM